MEKIDWNDFCKIRLKSYEESFQKHEIVKLLIVIKLLKRYKKKNFIKIFTEFTLDNGDIADIYFEDFKSKAVYIYEIKKNLSKDWVEEKRKAYLNYEVYNMKTIDFIPIILEELSNDIVELNKQLEKYIL